MSNTQLKLTPQQQNVVDYFGIVTEISIGESGYKDFLLYGRSEPIKDIFGEAIMSKHVKAKDEKWSKEKGAWRKVGESFVIGFTEIGFNALIASLSELMDHENAEPKEEKQMTLAEQTPPPSSTNRSHSSSAMVPASQKSTSNGAMTNGSANGLQKQQDAAMSVGSTGIQLSSLDEMLRFASMVLDSGMAPKGYKKPEEIVVAIQMGFELDMKPLMALQSIAVINGMPAVWGKGAFGKVISSKVYERHEESFEGEGVTRKAICKIWRKGNPNPHIGTFSYDDAKTAALLSKDTYQKYQDTMFMWRARSRAFDAFSDVLKGFAIAEVVMDYPPEAFNAGAVPSERPKFEDIQEAEVVAQS